MKKKLIAGGIALVLVLAVVTGLFFLPGEGALERRFLMNQKRLHAPTAGLEKISWDGETLVMADGRAVYSVRRLEWGRLEITVEEERASDVMVYNLLGKIVSIDGVPISEFVKVQ